MTEPKSTPPTQPAPPLVPEPPQPRCALPGFMMAGDSPAPYEEAPVADVSPDDAVGLEDVAHRAARRLANAGVTVTATRLIPEPQGAFVPQEEANKYAGIQGIVRGGTTTSAYDNALQASMADAEKRRDQDDAEHRLAQVPVEQGGALMFERELAPRMTSPRVLIRYVGKGRDVLSEQLCELVVDDSSGREEHLLIFVCPACFERGVPSGFAQCHVKASHRKWFVDTKNAGQIMAARNSDAPSGQEFYTSAGTIMDTDVLRCDNVNCGCAFKIHNNTMYRV